MNKVICLLAFLALVNAGGIKKTEAYADGKVCSGGTGDFVVSSLTYSPSVVKPGSTITYSVTGTFSTAQKVTGYHIKAFYSGISVRDTIVSQTAKSYSAGSTATLTVSQDFPDFAPAGTYVINFGLVNSANKDLNCWEFALVVS
jgi:ML domain